MALRCGIIGLPNVGKSTLFNALMGTAAAQVGNYPFCTIEPNLGVVAVPDPRLEALALLRKSAKIMPAYIEFVDIAGLVKNASKGEGLGNKFLGHIREVDAIIHVLRCFDDVDIVHVHDAVDPIVDAGVIETELAIADLESIEKRLPALEKKVKSGDKIIEKQVELLLACKKVLEQGKWVRILRDHVPLKELQGLQLLTSKPVLYVCNVLDSEVLIGNEHTKRVALMAAAHGADAVVISSKIEEEIARLDNQQEKKEFLAAMGLVESGLSKIVHRAYNLLNLKSFFTIGPSEARAWTFRDGTLADEAAGIIHSDFQRGFIRAEVISWEKYLEIGSDVKAKELGKVKLEGRDYKMQDGDVVHFRFNV